MGSIDSFNFLREFIVIRIKIYPREKYTNFLYAESNVSKIFNAI